MTKIGPMSSPFGKLLSKAGMADFVTGDLTKRGIFGGIAALSSLPLLFGQSQEDEEEGIDYANLPNIFDKYSTVCFIKAGSFIFPLIGTGARNGESVSTRILSKG